MAFSRVKALRTLQSSLRPAGSRAVPRASAPFRTQFVQRRYASGGESHGHEQSSDIPWMIGSVVVTVSSCYYLWPDLSQAEHHPGDHAGGHADHAEESEEKVEEASAEEETTEEKEPEEPKSDEGESKESSGDDSGESKDESKEEKEDDAPKEDDDNEEKEASGDKKEKSSGGSHLGGNTGAKHSGGADSHKLRKPDGTPETAKATETIDPSKRG